MNKEKHNMKKLTDLQELHLKKTILHDYKFGFTGEVYISSSDFRDIYNQYKSILEKYFSYKEPYYCNRNNSIFGVLPG